MYLKLKKERVEISLGYICQRAGIPSTGYLSDIFKGKRRLNSKYTEGILKAFRLKGQEKKFIGLLIAKDNSKSLEAIEVYNEQINKVRKSLSIKFGRLNSSSENWFFLCQVYTALGLFPGGASENQIFKFLFDLKMKEVRTCLNILLNKNFVTKNHENKFLWTKKHFILEGSSSDGTHNQYFTRALQKSMRLFLNQYEDKKNNLFMSQVISVKMINYQQTLEKLRSTLLEYQSEMEKENADNLVYFNVLIAPHKYNDEELI